MIQIVYLTIEYDMLSMSLNDVKVNYALVDTLVWMTLDYCNL